ncbi:hypothetical protein IEQ34_004552 [Dendrobium chrysotoxum]|uniref:Uncharacterized protein n=1 Tax=Dendrobium chrysotoxum TaxID=161865 RepID=A0AAV7HHJ8_DENCH|nr:hypothetical protein IEQ34_004552 [Dendrobium chrysotoxum]
MAQGTGIPVHVRGELNTAFIGLEDEGGIKYGVPNSRSPLAHILYHLNLDTTNEPIGRASLSVGKAAELFDGCWGHTNGSDFEKKYMELTKGAADNYHQSWWKRNGVVLDEEIGALCVKHGL